MVKSIVREWVTELGLRHQGVLVAAVRGCDTLPKEHPFKTLARHYRGEILKAHCGDPAKAASFTVPLSEEEFFVVSDTVIHDLDALPLHYVLHFIHAAQILGYYHPQMKERAQWNWFYLKAVKKLHLNPESRMSLDARLNASEEEFAKAQ